MTAHRITAKEIAAYRTECSTAIYAGHTVSHVNRILDALESSYAEVDRLRAELDLIKLDAEGEQHAKSKLYDALFPGEPDVEREVRWKWMIMEVNKLQAELDALRSQRAAEGSGG